MIKALHPLLGGVYELRDDGMVQVEQDGRQGIFRPDGEWISGELKWADQHYCFWLSNKCSQTAPLRNPLIGN
ncbi:transposase [Parasphingopyxis marina]|uniref:Transposase n=1 Tax=Parasphingopyxis marina TaxID=2761622 RepID=A0A842HXG0_9SPHN|nr:transposase [Parasphingopyxis marina]MBC2776630.1 transposase [Parasphingopyxis marina]